MRPEAAPGPAGSPVAMTSACLIAWRSKIGVRSWLSWSAGTRATASCQVMSFSFTISQAMRTAATPVRLPLRVWSMKSLPFSTVNSKSCISRKCFSSEARTSSSSL